jgi:GH15 family glucan-1,4-alpha-glucosidase
MAWLALDRATRIAAARGDRHRHRHQRWIIGRDALAHDIRSRGFDTDQQAYTGVYGSTELDAAVLVLPTLGLEPLSSPRVASTVDAIRRQLSAGGPLLYRYPPGTDGLEGREGAFLACSFWLVQALARTGRQLEAESLLDELLPLGGPLGLYGEEMDPVTGDHLGNFPQALTHAALVQAVLSIASFTTQPGPKPAQSW